MGTCQVSSTSVSCTLKNGCKFIFTTALLVLWLSAIFVLLCTNSSSILFLFFCCFRFVFVCLIFLFIHYSSVTAYLDLVARFLKKKLPGRTKPMEEPEFRGEFFLLYKISYFFVEKYLVERSVACWIILFFFCDFFYFMINSCLRGSVF